MAEITKVYSHWTLEMLQPGTNSQVRTSCNSIRIRNMSTSKVLYLAPQGSSYRLPVPPGGVWGIDLFGVSDELETVIDVYTEQHDAPVTVERISKRPR